MQFIPQFWAAERIRAAARFWPRSAGHRCPIQGARQRAAGAAMGSRWWLEPHSPRPRSEARSMRFRN